MNKIKTAHVFPPIPDRRWDWCAWHDGKEEAGHYGWGRTEAAALADLRRLDQERGEPPEELPEDAE
jgi:hypothetical protein